MSDQISKSQSIVLFPGEGRAYDMGTIQAVFKADNDETAQKYSVSEWWLEAKSKGPGIHSHDEDDLFYVLEGTMSFFIEDKWIDAPKGSFILAASGRKHDFENRSNSRSGILNFSVPGDFEKSMPMIVNWFQKHPPGMVE
jgi:quercetin dioxygenase-like cupin family protein